MFARVTIRATDVEASARFYDTVLATLGRERSAAEPGAVAWGDFAVAPLTDGEPPTRRLHIGFSAPTRPHADAFWEAGRAAGAPDDGAPGPRTVYGPDYYGAFLLDPGGNSAEAVHHDTVPEGRIDHLWIRVADVPASRAFYVGFGEAAGFGLSDDTPERAQFRPSQGGGSFSVVAGDAPTAHVRMTFPDAPARTERDPDGNVAEVA
jgi:catechol 2,3-dioxygenase-like lactoylglutathione lyase family enzyme